MNSRNEPEMPIKPHEKDAILTHKEAEAASPDNLSVGGEEDPGVALEDLVEKH